MPLMSSPHDAAPSTVTRTSVPGARRRRPVASATGWFLASRTSRSRPPTARNRGVPTVAPPAFCAGPDDGRRLLRLQVDPVDRLRRRVDARTAHRQARGPSPRGRSGAAPSAGVNVKSVACADRHHAVQPVETGHDVGPHGRDDRRADLRGLGRLQLAVGVGQQVERLASGRRRRGRSPARDLGRGPPGPNRAPPDRRWPS